MEIEGLGGEVRFREKVLWVFVSPSRCFEALKENPDWLKAWVLVALVAILPGAVLLSSVDLRQMAEDAVDLAEFGLAESQEDYEPLSEEKRQEQIELTAKVWRYQFTAGIAVGKLAWLFVVSGAVHLLSTALGVRGKFSGVLSIWAYSSVVGIPESLIRAVIVAATKQWVPGLSPAYLFAPGSISPVFHMVLLQLNPFLIWQLGLGVLGLCVLRGASREKSFGVVFGLWVVWIAYVMISVLRMAPPVA